MSFTKREKRTQALKERLGEGFIKWCCIKHVELLVETIQ